jgi:hypothetical protein
MYSPMPQPAAGAPMPVIDARNQAAVPARF